MSESSLPDDIRDWPADPAELLGLARNAGLRELRRAYSRLIRRFKPEHHPAEFRRIRDAYEALEPRARLYEQNTAEETGPDEPASLGGPDEDDGDFAGPSGTLSRPAADRRAPEDDFPRGIRTRFAPEASREFDLLWKNALGDEEGWPAVYRELSRAARHGERDELCYCRLYWLLKLAPELDPARRPAAWLAAGLNRASGMERLASLYIEELRRRPEEALEPGAGELLLRERPHWQLTEIARHRWRALLRLGRFESIEADLNALCRPLYFDRDARLRLLFCATDVLVWSSSEEAQRGLDACRREIEAAADRHLAFTGALDRLEYGLELGAEFKQCHQFHFVDPPGALFRLLPELWLWPVEQVRPQLTQALESLVVASPAIALERLDLLHEAGRALLGYATGIMRSLCDPHPSRDAQTRELIARRVGALIESRDWRPYGAFRPGLAEFCIESGLTVEDVLGVVERPEYADFAAAAPLTYLCGDRPLRCLLMAHRAFWQ